MPFCTIVEFEFSESFGRDDFQAWTTRLAAAPALPPGCLSQIAGDDETGARLVEVWRSAQDAQGRARTAMPLLTDGRMPEPSRLVAFAVTSYVVA